MAKPSKTFRPAVVSANHLRTGFVQFRTEAGGWSPRIADAQVAETPDIAEGMLAAAQADQNRALLLDPVLVEITREGGAIRPVTLRERIRAEGPTTPAGVIPADADKEPAHVSL